VLEGPRRRRAEIRASALLRAPARRRLETLRRWPTDESVVLNVSPPFGAGEPVPEPAAAATVGGGLRGEIGAIGARRRSRGWMVGARRGASRRRAGVQEVRSAVDQQARMAKALDPRWVAAEAAGRWRRRPSEIATARHERRRGARPSTGCSHRCHRPGAGRRCRGLPGAASARWWGRSDRRSRRGGGKVERLTLIDRATLERDRAGARERLAAERGQQLLRAMINERRKDTPVTVDDELMERFAPRG
jgi:hypothetical protein